MGAQTATPYTMQNMQTSRGMPAQSMAMPMTATSAMSTTAAPMTFTPQQQQFTSSPNTLTSAMSAPMTTISAPNTFASAMVPQSGTRIVQQQSALPSSAALLSQGQIVSERLISLEECYGTGLVRSEGEAPVATAPPNFAYEVQPLMQPPTIAYEVLQPETEEIVVGPEGQVMEVIEVAQTSEEQPRLPVCLIVATSGNLLGESHPTGAWLEEIAGPYYVFLEAGCEVHVASTLGGAVPIDEASTSDDFFTENARRFLEEYPDVLQNSIQLGQIAPEQVDCVFLAGGHGVYADFEENLAQFVTDANVMGKTIGAVCHGVAGLLSAINPDSQPFIQGRKVTGFTNEEEAAVGLDQQVPYLLESRMMELGGDFQKQEPFSEFAIRDGNLITGQNPQSSVQAALLCVEAMGDQLAQSTDNFGAQVLTNQEGQL